MEKKEEEKIKKNIGERMMVKLGVGCPFRDFGPCITDRCAFFVITDLYTGDSECAIRASYFQQLLNDVTIRSVSLFSTGAKEPLLEISLHLVVENLVSALRHIDGLSVDPVLAPHLRSKIREMRRDLWKALKIFSGKKG